MCALGGFGHASPWCAAALGSIPLHARCSAVALGDVQLCGGTNGTLRYSVARVGPWPYPMVARSGTRCSDDMHGDGTGRIGALVAGTTRPSSFHRAISARAYLHCVPEADRELVAHDQRELSGSMGSDRRRILGGMRPILKSDVSSLKASTLRTVWRHSNSANLLHTLRRTCVGVGCADLSDGYLFGVVRIHTGISREIG